MSIPSLISANNTQYKKIYPKLAKNIKLNVNQIMLYRNKSDKNIFEDKYNENGMQKILLKRKGKVFPFNNNHFNKSNSASILSKANNNFPKSKKYYIKSPLNFFQGISLPSTQNLNLNKNVPLLSINTNKNTNITQSNPHKTVEYNSINCIINNFNLSCKNIDSHPENKKAELFKYKKYYEFFCKNKKELRNHIINLKKSCRMKNSTNKIKGVSHIGDMNSSNKNNISNDDITTEDLENKQIHERIQKRHQENKKNMLYLKELEKKNQKLRKDYQEVKIKNIEYNKSLERLFKLLRALKKNGMDTDEMMDNISSGEDYDEYLNVDLETEENEEKEEQEEEKNEVVLSDGSVISNLQQLSSGFLRSHDEFTKGSKLNLKTNIIPMLNMCKIKKSKISI